MDSLEISPFAFLHSRTERRSIANLTNFPIDSCFFVQEMTARAVDHPGIPV